MHASLGLVVAELQAIAEAINVLMPTDAPLSISQSNWSFPSVTRYDLTIRATALADQISSSSYEPPDSALAYLAAVVDRLAFLRANTIPNLVANGATAVPAYLITIDALDKAFSPLFINDPKMLAQKNAQALKRAGAQIRAMENRLKELGPRTDSLEGMVGRIESAHDAADQLPTDLETLSEAQKKVSELLRDAERDRAHVLTSRESVEELDKGMKERAGEAVAILALCESAYSSATSLGLSAAFSERSKKLDSSMWIWVIGLVSALGLGGIFGTSQLQTLSKLMTTPDASPSLISLNLMLSVLSVGAPIWFAWLATKQIGQRFRLSEDYAFKASISRAYEGYRREAARIDPDLEAQLLQSALSRLDEQPLRLVESASYGSPWHELLSSDAVKDAAKTIPGFVDKVTGFANEALHKIKPKASPAVSVESEPAASEGDKI
ncbi:hypothetical protein [Pseudomonas coronafaciens]|uniref:hypothetical protein n=1 Tax=Pseudomonas coronafaciens TaxID=53409 RepID=UPI0006B600B9|nr:hypothetical protein [Pseudomonas coronafaciens]KPB56084.1 Uncharacterized protein AC511_4795 [Pseudomonas coronafaciens pv. oryzae]